MPINRGTRAYNHLFAEADLRITPDRRVGGSAKSTLH